MIDNFRHHSSDWSQVPLRDETLRLRTEALYGYAVHPPLHSAPIKLDRYYTAQAYAEPVYVQPTISVGLAYVLWLLFGLLGAHYFYINKPGVGVLYLLTGGLLGVGWVLDLFTLKGQVERANRRVR